jgi:hypothetical protein
MNDFPDNSGITINGLTEIIHEIKSDLCHKSFDIKKMKKFLIFIKKRRGKVVFGFF